MTIYTVNRQDKNDAECYVELLKKGCFFSREMAFRRAKTEYECMRNEYKSEMLKYSDEDVYDPHEHDSGALFVEEDNEYGYYFISFGMQKHYESHVVWVEEWEIDDLTGLDPYNMYKAYKRMLLIEDIKEKAAEMEVELSEKDILRVAEVAERSISDNESLSECYWMSIEYAIEEL